MVGVAFSEKNPNFSKYLDLYRRNTSGTCQKWLQKRFPNGEHRIWKCYNKKIVLKVNKSNHVKINLWLYLIFNSFFSKCSDFTPPENIIFKGYKMGTWGNGNGIKQHSISLGLKKLC